MTLKYDDIRDWAVDNQSNVVSFQLIFTDGKGTDIKLIIEKEDLLKMGQLITAIFPNKLEVKA